jgi:hypothetical protein
MIILLISFTTDTSLFRPLPHSEKQKINQPTTTMFNMISNFLAAAPETDATASPAPVAPATKKPLSAASAEFVPEPVEFEPQSANMDAEVEGEMKECLDAILKNQQNGMNFAAATKAKLTTISMGAQRKGLEARERSRNNSEEEASNGSSSDSEHSDIEGTAASSPTSRANEDDDESCWADEEYTSVKSFGTKRVTGFYRTKEQRDETRRKHLAEVAQRAGRRPNERNVAAKAHYASDRDNRQRRYEVRGGRQSAHASALVQ